MILLNIRDILHILTKYVIKLAKTFNFRANRLVVKHKNRWSKLHKLYNEKYGHMSSNVQAENLNCCNKMKVVYQYFFLKKVSKLVGEFDYAQKENVIVIIRESVSPSALKVLC